MPYVEGDLCTSYGTHDTGDTTGTKRFEGLAEEFARDRVQDPIDARHRSPRCAAAGERPHLSQTLIGRDADQAHRGNFGRRHERGLHAHRSGFT